MIKMSWKKRLENQSRRSEKNSKIWLKILKNADDLTTRTMNQSCRTGEKNKKTGEKKLKNSIQIWDAFDVKKWKWNEVWSTQQSEKGKRFSLYTTV